MQNLKKYIHVHVYVTEVHYTCTCTILQCTCNTVIVSLHSTHTCIHKCIASALFIFLQPSVPQSMYSNLTQLRRMADRFAGSNHFAADTLQRQVAKISSKFSRFETHLAERRRIVVGSLRFHSSYTEVRCIVHGHVGLVYMYICVFISAYTKFGFT